MANFDAVKFEVGKRLMACDYGKSVVFEMKADGAKVEVEEFMGQFAVDFHKYAIRSWAKSLDEVALWLMEYPKKAVDERTAEDNYEAENKPKLRAYFDTYFKGKTMEQISREQALADKAYQEGKCGSELPDVGDWGFYSDWHKDVFGYRPHGVVCGEYVNPYTLA